MPRFVVLEHTWDGVHWDFMLEAGGVLRTWALEAPIVPGSGQPARRLADHRLAYLDYEGPISRSRGAVRRVAEGSYRVLHWTETTIRLHLEGDQLAGMVELRSEGAGASETPDFSWNFRFGNFD